MSITFSPTIRLLENLPQGNNTDNEAKDTCVRENTIMRVAVVADDGTSPQVQVTEQQLSQSHHLMG